MGYNAMEVDWIYGLVGGLLIGAAGALYLLSNGRIMGASGILGGLIDGSGRATLVERTTFVVALILVPTIFAVLKGGAETYATEDTWALVVGGVLVGFGTRIATGCTSGHGVCGISRLSPRSILATLVYLGAGVLTMAVFRSVLGVI